MSEREPPKGLRYPFLVAVWVIAFVFSYLLVGWQLCEHVYCAWQWWSWEHCFPVESPVAILAFEGILLAAVALSVQKDGNKIFNSAAANHKTVVCLVLLILASAGMSGFALLHYTLGCQNLSIGVQMSTTLYRGVIAFLSFFLFVWTLSIWGLLLLFSMLRDLWSSPGKCRQRGKLTRATADPKPEDKRS